MNNRVSALQVLAHGKALQACLNGALVSVKNRVTGKWEPYSSNWQCFCFSEEFSYRTKTDPGAPAIESPAFGNTAFDPELPETYRDFEFTFEQVKAHGAVIQYFLRGGTTEWSSDVLGPYNTMTNDCVYAWKENVYYRIAQSLPTPPPQTGPCACDICADESTQEVARYAKQKMETLAPPPFVGQTVPKPPLGCEPEYIWVEKRIAALRSAVSRQIMESSAESINWRLVANWSAEILERKEQLEGINRRPKAA